MEWSGIESRPANVEFVVDQVALVQVFLTSLVAHSQYHSICVPRLFTYLSPILNSLSSCWITSMIEMLQTEKCFCQWLALRGLRYQHGSTLNLNNSVFLCCPMMLPTDSNLPHNSMLYNNKCVLWLLIKIISFSEWLLQLHQKFTISHIVAKYTYVHNWKLKPFPKSVLQSPKIMDYLSPMYLGVTCWVLLHPLWNAN